jgi:hypothetical protein
VRCGLLRSYDFFEQFAPGVRLLGIRGRFRGFDSSEGLVISHHVGLHGPIIGARTSNAGEPRREVRSERVAAASASEEAIQAETVRWRDQVSLPQAFRR